MAGLPLPPFKIAFVVGGLNLFGALTAFSIGGLGIGETTLAGILMAIRVPPDQAIATALIVRPSALANVLVCGGLIAGAISRRAPRVALGLTRPRG